MHKAEQEKSSPFRKSIAGCLFSAAALSLCLFTSPAQAQNGTLDYHVVSDPSVLPLYADIFKAMAPVYKKSPYDETASMPVGYPQIFIALAKLNPAAVQAVAKPVESGDGANPRFCKTWDICPHYVVQKTKDAMKVLGVFDAVKIEIDTARENGFHKLKVFTDADKKESFDSYVFSEEMGGYVLVPLLRPEPRPDTLKP